MARRGNGEGTISKRKGGGYRGAYFDNDGKRKWLYGKTRAEVSTKLTAALEARAKGQRAVSSKANFGQLLDAWLEQKRGSVRGNTYASYEPQVRLHIKPALGSIALKALTPERLDAYYTAKRDEKKPLSPRTIRLHHTIINQVLQQAVKRGRVAVNAAQLTGPLPRSEAHAEALTHDESLRLLAAIRGDRLEAAYILALTSGLRRGEVCALTWEGVDLNAGLLRVTHTLTKVDGEWVRTEPKTKASRRVVRLAGLAVDALTAHKARAMSEAAAEKRKWSDASFVFTGAKGGPVDGTWLGRALQKHEKAAGIPERSFHSLRHTLATTLMDLGTNPKVVAEMLGHSEVGITLNTYSHVGQHLQEAAAASIDERFRQERDIQRA